jgi:hypothetical protein
MHDPDGHQMLIVTAEQISTCTQSHSGNPAPFAGWFSSPEDFTNLSGVAAKCLAVWEASASMERQFSVTRHVATPFQMPKLPQTLATQVLIQAKILAMERVQSTAMEAVHRDWKAQHVSR